MVALSARTARAPTLAEYRKKRNFAKTAEPAGKAKRLERAAAASPAAGASFVVQKHAARRLHYDFRLELDGVLLSWAVPKGPSLDPSVKRLAVETEPHPLEYGGFEGTIPKGEYGGGTVMVWDRGTWQAEGDARDGYRRGRLSFRLEGEKLRGAWHLVRTRAGDAEGKSWLLFKSRDEFSRAGENAIVEEAPDSALSGRTLADIEAGKRVKKPATGPSKAQRASKPGNARKAPSGRRASRAKDPLPSVPLPELATLVSEAPEGEDWVHELKFDGYRLLARLEGGEVRLFTRGGNDWTERLPALARAFAALEVDSALVDGELVALDERGISRFQVLQNSLSAGRDGALVFYAFDVLHLDGKDLTQEPLLARKQELASLFSARKTASKTLRVSEHVVGRGGDFFTEACRLGVEGIISKRASSPYRPGRGRDWLKVKCLQRQEFVVVGYTDPEGSRSHLGALLLGLHRDGELTYAGRVGTGFNAASLRELADKLAPLAAKRPPVANPPRGAEARGVHWVRPELVAEVAFTDMTDEGRLRHPTFQGLRDDKTAAEVVPELPSAPPRTARKAAGYPLTHPDKVLYPEQGITKRELLDYYALVAERLLPHVANRPLTLVRCPDGRDKPCFFQKHPGAGMPAHIRSVAIREQEGKAPYSVIDDEQGLFGLVQLGALEIHTWGSRADDFEHPDLLVFDLDPDPKLPFETVIEAALELKRAFDSEKLETFVKTAGGKGLHVCLPIAPELEWDELKAFSARVAGDLARRRPDRYVSTVSKAKRKGKIFVDYLRNARGATFVAPYSTRARENAPIALPLDWDELEPGLDPSRFTLRTVKARLARPDPFARMAGLRQSLRALLRDRDGEA